MKKNITLNNLNINSAAIVKKINDSSIKKRRFLDLGLIEGTKITPVFKSIFGDPIAYEIRGTIIAIRANDAKNIYVEN